MALKTYLYGLYLAFHAAQRYGTRWQARIEASLGTTERIDCFRAVLAALNACIPLILPSPPVD